MNKLITYFGILKSITSWSKVARELISALIKQGIDINIYERKGFLYNSNMQLDYSIKSRISNTFKGDIVLTFENPIVYNYLPKTTFNIGLLVYEYSILPELWIERINKYLDMVIVPSNFCKNIFINSGVDSKKIRVLRYGINERYYYKSLKKENHPKRFQFLCVAAPHKREGIELLLESYTKAFTSKDDVLLLLKLSYIPGRNPKPFEYQNLMDLIDFYRSKDKAPCIKIIKEELKEEEMGDLYRNSDYYFSMTRGEAFGLCFLESIACGVPVICINWGGQKDFLDTYNSKTINYTLVPINDESYEDVPKNCKIALPDIDNAIDIIKQVYNNKDIYYKDLLKNPNYFYWSTIAKEFIDIISKI